MINLLPKLTQQERTYAEAFNIWYEAHVGAYMDDPELLALQAYLAGMLAAIDLLDDPV